MRLPRWRDRSAAVASLPIQNACVGSTCIDPSGTVLRRFFGSHEVQRSWEECEKVPSLVTSAQLQ